MTWTTLRLENDILGGDSHRTHRDACAAFFDTDG